MKVFVINKVIDLKEVIHIEKHDFNSRGCGFNIYMSDGTIHEFSRKIAYETYSSEVSDIFKTWDRLIKGITEEWQKVAEPIKIFKI